MALLIVGANYVMVEKGLAFFFVFIASVGCPIEIKNNYINNISILAVACRAFAPAGFYNKLKPVSK